MKLKKWIIGALMLSGLIHQACARMDEDIEKTLRCQQMEELGPEVAVYKLLTNANIVVREQRGPLNVFVGAFLDGKSSTTQIFNLTPSRIMVVTRNGVETAMIGSLFSANYPLSDEQIIGSYQGGLKRKIKLMGLSGLGISSSQVQAAGISEEPVYKDIYLMVGKLGNGERFTACGKKQTLLGITK